MSTGAIKFFAQGLHDLGNKLHDLDSDDLRMAIVTTATVPATTTAAPHFGGTGTTNFASSEVAKATGYAAPIVLANKTWTVVAGVPTLRADIVTIAQDAAGFTNGAYGIIYNNTDANKRAIGFIELSAAGSLSLVAGQVVVDWSGATNDIFTITP